MGGGYGPTAVASYPPPSPSSHARVLNRAKKENRVTGAPSLRPLLHAEARSDLARFGNAVLGNDNHTGAEVPRPEGMATSRT